MTRRPPQLADFGLSHLLSEEQTHIETASWGTVRWAAPALRLAFQLRCGKRCLGPPLQHHTRRPSSAQAGPGQGQPAPERKPPAAR